MKSQKISFITTGDINDIATSKRAFGLAVPLTELGWEVHLILQDSEGNRNHVALECNEQIHVHYFNVSNAINEIRAKNSIIKKIKPDYIYLCAFVTRNIVKSYGAKKLVEHSELASKIQDVPFTKRAFLLILELYSMLYSSALLNASKYLQSFFIKKASTFGIKTPQFYFPYAYSQVLFKKLALESIKPEIQKLKNKINFVYIGTITANYGTFTMLEAFQQIVSKHPNIRLIMLGKGRSYTEALEYVKSNNLYEHVSLPGFVSEEEIEHYFSIADFFISPMNDTIQDWARCPSKMYMYLPYKKPIITCKIGEPFEVLKDAGIYFEPGSSKSLSNVLCTILDNKSTFTLVEPEYHTWEYRAKELTKWIEQTFTT